MAKAMTDRLFARLHPAVHRRVGELAARRGLSMSEAARTLIERGLKVGELLEEEVAGR